MKKKMAMIVAGLLLAAGTAVRADNEWGVYGTFWSPSDADDSYGGGFKLGIEMVDRVQLDVRYSIFNNVFDDGPDLEVDPLEFGLSFAIPMSDDVETALGAGLGYYFMDGDDVLDADDEVGFFMSAGLEWTIHRSGATYGETSAKLFVEGIYRFVETGDIDLNGPGVNVGLLIGW